MKIIGYERYGGGSRWLTARAYGPLVEISVEGTDGDGSIMLTPHQVRIMLSELELVAAVAMEATMLEAEES